MELQLYACIALHVVLLVVCSIVGYSIDDEWDTISSMIARTDRLSRAFAVSIFACVVMQFIVIDAMYQRDKYWGVGYVVFLWLAYGFTFFTINAVNTDSGIRMAMIISGLLVLVYNTASMVAMIRHYGEDKEQIYSIDIRHLDEIRQRKQAGYSSDTQPDPTGAS